METRGKRKGVALDNSKRSGKRSKKDSKDLVESLASKDKVSQSSRQGAPLTRRRSKEAGQKPVAANSDPERLLHSSVRHTARTASPRPQVSSPKMEQRGQDPHDMEMPDEEDYGHSASSAMEGLLRRLGAGLGGFGMSFASGGNSRVRAIVQQLKDEGDEMAQLEGLTELCEYLSISTEESLLTFPVETVVPLLVRLLGMEHNPDIMLLAARALTFLADVYPPACASIIRHGAVPVFCARLLTIEFIDLAEQSLQALEKLSHDHPGALLMHGGLVACLSYLDFFPTGVQRTAVATAANICHGLTPEHSEAVSTAAPILIGLLQYPDAKLVDTACLALTRIAEAFSKSPDQLDLLCGFGLITSITQMVRVEESGTMTGQLSVSTFYGLIKLLATCAAGSAKVAESLLQAGISTTIHNLLTTSALFSSSAASPGNALRSTDQLGELVSLAVQLLPPVPDAAAAVLQDIPPSPSFEEDAPVQDEAGERGEDEGGGSGQRGSAPLVAFLEENPHLMGKLTSDLLAPLIQVYSSSAGPAAKRQCLAAIAKLLFFNPPPALEDHTRDLPLSTFVAALLRAKDASLVAGGMQIAEILMAKLPEVYRSYFMKEGVLHALEQLGEGSGLPPPGAAAAATSAGPSPAAAPTTGESSGRRRGGASGLRRSRSGGRAEGGEGQEPEGAPSGSARTPAGDTLRAALAARAQKFVARHFTGENGERIACATEGVAALRDISSRLPELSAISDLVAALAATGSQSVSSFELLSSGAVAALKDYLQGADLALREASSGGSPGGQPYILPLLKRMSQFAAVTLPPGSGSAPPLAALVAKLLGSLATCEGFSVQTIPVKPPPSLSLYEALGRAAAGGAGGALNRTVSGASSSLSAGLSALSNPLKVRLVRSSDDSSLRDFGSVVVIDALASMVQLEEFLWPRVRPTAAAAAAGREDSRSRQAQPGGGQGSAGLLGVGAASVNNRSSPAGAADGGRGGHSRRSRGRKSGEGEGDVPLTAESGGRQASRNRPIPSGKRLTRAQARAAAEAEVADNTPEEGTGVAPRPQAVGSGGAEGGVSGSMDDGLAALFGGSQELVVEAGDEQGGSEEDIPSDEEGLLGVDYMDEDDYDDEEEDDELGVGSLSVHDMHLLEEQEERAVLQAGWEASGAIASAPEAGASRAEPRHGTAGTVAGQSYAEAAGRGARGHPSPHGRGHPTSRHSHHHHQQQQTRRGSEESDPSLAFYLGEALLSPPTTIFQAVLSNLQGSSQEIGGIWNRVHTLHYRPYAAAMRLKESEAAASVMVEPSSADVPTASSTAVDSRMDHDDVAASPLAELVPAPDVAAELAAPQEARDILVVLRVLESLSRLFPHLQSYLEGRQGRFLGSATPLPGNIPREEFVSAKLSPKLSQQLKDVLSICGGSLPAWCHQLVHGYKFLFPFEIRRRFFYCTSFGLGRALGYLQQMQAAEHGPGSAADRDARESRIGRLQRQKVRISRRHLLESALKVFAQYAAPRSQLEVEFFGEVGTGLGPTLEFYTLLSHELQRRSLGIWRESDALGGGAEKQAAGKAGGAALEGGGLAIEDHPSDAPGPVAGELAAELDANHSVRSSELVRAPQGLFPAPLPPSQRSAESMAVRLFTLLGRVTAKALQDSRLLDLPLSPLFYRLALGGRVDLYDIKKFDAALGSSIEKLHAAYHAHQAGGGQGPLLVDGCAVEDLCLSFQLPGYPGYQLAPHGEEVMVGSGTMREYIDAVVDATLGGGVSSQIEAFRSGFCEIFPLDCLRCFYEDEIEAMLCGTGESWTVEQLQDSIKFDHGYNSQSPPVRHLLEVLAELDALDQRRFLRFVTGSPRLPPGGLAALQPRLTVVRKHSAAGGDASGTSVPGSLPSVGAGTRAASGGKSPADGDLPSVMTCVNYIKLPPYSSKEVTRDRLLFAIREGQGSFDLS